MLAMAPSPPPGALSAINIVSAEAGVAAAAEGVNDDFIASRLVAMLNIVHHSSFGTAAEEDADGGINQTWFALSYVQTFKV